MFSGGSKNIELDAPLVTHFPWSHPASTAELGLDQEESAGVPDSRASSPSHRACASLHCDLEGNFILFSSQERA